MCMAEYLPHLEELLERQVVEAVSFIDGGRHFIEALVPLFGRPLEADPVFCRKATFLAGSGPFAFLAHFFLSTQFPKQQPSLMLQSTQYGISVAMAHQPSLLFCLNIHGVKVIAIDQRLFGGRVLKLQKAMQRIKLSSSVMNL